MIFDGAKVFLSVGPALFFFRRRPGFPPVADLCPASSAEAAR
jgi:hypothetical protein